MILSRRVGWQSAVVFATLLSGVTPGNAQSRPQPPALAAEQSDVAVLAPAGPHRVFVQAGDGSTGANVLDADSDGVKILGLVPITANGVMTVSRDASRILVADSFYSRGDHGTREDILAVYDGQTLNRLKEIPLPGRLWAFLKAQDFDVSEDGRLAYVYDLVPASSIHVVDLDKGSVVTSVDLPGCALAFPYGPRSFGTICGDGTVGAVNVPETGSAKATFSKPFFDANTDPIFEASVIDKSSGQAWFLTYSGRIFPVQLGGSAPLVGKPWSLNNAAGFTPAGTGVQELAWRPGGGQLMAVHRASKQLYVLMHIGPYWTHKQAGTEVWVFDSAGQKLKRRIKLETPTKSISVSQDASPLLYAVAEESGEFTVLDATTGEHLRKRKLSGMMMWVPGI